MRNCLIILITLILGNNFVWGSSDEKDYFTATQSATTSSVMSARQKALMYARNTLSTMINGKIENVTKSYVENNSGTGESSDEFVSETKMAVRMLLQNVSIADESVVKEKKGDFTVYITLKMKKDDILHSICRQLSESNTTKDAFQEKEFSALWKKNNK